MTGRRTQAVSEEPTEKNNKIKKEISIWLPCTVDKKSSTRSNRLPFRKDNESSGYILGVVGLDLELQLYLVLPIFEMEMIDVQDLTRIDESPTHLADLTWEAPFLRHQPRSSPFPLHACTLQIKWRKNLSISSTRSVHSLDAGFDFPLYIYPFEDEGVEKSDFEHMISVEAWVITKFEDGPNLQGSLDQGMH
ncbi:hypothetical protein LXL04_028179 [Taraxacum kok-saghyz]